MKENRLFLAATYILLCLSASNFYEKGSICFLLLIIFFLWNAKGKLIIQIETAVSAILGLTIFMFGAFQGDFALCIKSVNYAFSFCLGCFIFSQQNDKCRLFENVMMSLFAGAGLYAVITYIYNAGIGFSTRRILYDYWTKSEINVTGVGIITAIVSGFSFYGILICKNKLIKVSTLILTTISLSLSLISATRGPILLFVLCWLFMLIIYAKIISSKKLFGFSFTALIVGSVIYFRVLPSAKFQGILSQIPVFSRLSEEGLHTGRTVLLRKFIGGLIEYPFGGAHVSALIGQEAHTVLLEAGDLYGIIGFLMISLIMISSVYKCFQLIKKVKKAPVLFSVIGFYFVTIIESNLEPVLNGYPVLIWSLSFVNGLVAMYLQHSEREMLE